MFIVRERTEGFTNRTEIVGGEVVVSDDAFQFVESIRFMVFHQSINVMVLLKWSKAMTYLYKM